jgi:hypothetical protein
LPLVVAPLAGPRRSRLCSLRCSTAQSLVLAAEASLGKVSKPELRAEIVASRLPEP